MPARIGKRYIDGDELVEKFSGTTFGDLRRWVRRQRRAPELVNNQGAADILGILPTHMSRVRDRLPEPVEVEGTDRSSLYLKSEIEALADELRQEREAKSTTKEKA